MRQICLISLLLGSYIGQGEINRLSLFDLDYDFLERSRQPNPDRWGASEPHNAYNETPVWMKATGLIHAEDRLESSDITRSIKYHPSWKYAPDPPDDKCNMVTRRALERKFGATRYAVELSEYESGCKNRWNAGYRPVGHDHDCCKRNDQQNNPFSDRLTDHR